eukprot:g23410.t1
MRRMLAVPLTIGLLCRAPSTWVPQAIPRRAVLVSLPLALPATTALAQEGPEQRMALYRGKVVGLRESAEWYRFFVGDVVRRPLLVKLGRGSW